MVSACVANKQEPQPVHCEMGAVEVHGAREVLKQVQNVLDDEKSELTISRATSEWKTGARMERDHETMKEEFSKTKFVYLEVSRARTRPQVASSFFRARAACH